MMNLECIGKITYLIYEKPFPHPVYPDFSGRWQGEGF
jgi:hypothetical protein